MCRRKKRWASRIGEYRKGELATERDQQFKAKENLYVGGEVVASSDVRVGKSSVCLADLN